MYIEILYYKTKNHLQYLNTELSSFSLFDNRIDVETKTEMVRKLDTPFSEIKITDKSQISEFISINNMIFLKSSNLNLEFLLHPVLD